MGPPNARAALADDVERRLDRVGFLANGLGALLVMVSLVFLFPNNVDHDQYVTLLKVTVPIFIVYMAIALPLGRILAIRRGGLATDWLREDRPATDAERIAVLRHPLVFARVAGTMWGFAALIGASIWFNAGIASGDVTGTTVLLGGLTACALQYLLVERIMRPVTALALAGGPPAAGHDPRGRSAADDGLGAGHRGAAAGRHRFRGRGPCRRRPASGTS